MRHKSRQGAAITSPRWQPAPSVEAVVRVPLAENLTTDLSVDKPTHYQLRMLARAIRRLWRRLNVAPAVPGAHREDHSRPTADISLMISRSLGLSKELTQRIYRAAYLHDVGTIAVATSIFTKPGKLTKLQRASMQVHSAVGCELLRAFLPTTDLAKVALAHHERYDGEGYPQGLQGTKIPLESRIVTIADSVDAMMSPRAYRKTRSFAGAWGEIVRGAGGQFDPAIVDAYTHMRKLDVSPSMP